MNKLPISVGILSWKSKKTLINTLESYRNNGFFDIVDEILIFFQEIDNEDIEIAKKYNIKYVGYNSNVGIGLGLLKLAQTLNNNIILLLENDWVLSESQKITHNRLSSGINLINSNSINMVKYRHRANPGYPLFTYNVYYKNELNHYDDVIQLTSPHLLDSLHWCDPSILFPDHISKKDEYFISSSRWANWTNNPCMFNKNFYINYASQFIIKPNSLNPYNTPIGQITSEGEISYAWSRENFMVAQGSGLFTHKDIIKYGS
jgi:hypothetical protein